MSCGFFDGGVKNCSDGKTKLCSENRSFFVLLKIKTALPHWFLKKAYKSFQGHLIFNVIFRFTVNNKKPAAYSYNACCKKKHFRRLKLFILSRFLDTFFRFQSIKDSTCLKAMESTQRWGKKTPERKVDKELQRIKSLAVVSVLNKAFGDNEPVTRPRSGSQVENTRRPVSECYEPTKEDVEEFNKIPTEPFSAKGKYEISLKELEQAKDQIEEAKEQSVQQKNLLALQDSLVQALSEQIEYLMAENQKLTAQTKAQVSMQEIQSTMEDLRRHDWQKEVQNFNKRLSANESAIAVFESANEELKNDTRTQAITIEAKMEMMHNQLKEKNEMINRLHYEQHIKQMFPSKSTESSTSSRRSSNARPKSLLGRYKGALPAATPPPSAPLPPIPAESPQWGHRPNSAHYPERPKSVYDQMLPSRPTSVHDQVTLSRPHSIYDQKAFYQNKPLPTYQEEDICQSRPVSTHQEAKNIPISTYQHESLNQPVSVYKHESLNRSISVCDRESLSRPVSSYNDETLSRPVSTYEEEISEMVYYKEFNEQLQERLSTSKEIDHLSVWKPNDYDEIQKKLNSKNWLEEDQKSAFWKGMKKKLRV
ncbi:hypothetical protein BY458DRAFT_489922 [Sporodiniella umbellata]|nr:hypothetical protein BY458DRAFT_489922 [Sporodiniella umbellata]